MGACTSAGRVNGEACARLDNKVDTAPAQTLPVKEGRAGAGMVDTARSVASCSTTDCVQEVPARKRVSFSEAPAEVFHIVPYSEIYLLHPKKFVFGSDGRYVPNDESVEANLRSADAANAVLDILSLRSLDAANDDASASKLDVKPSRGFQCVEMEEVEVITEPVMASFKIRVVASPIAS